MISNRSIIKAASDTIKNLGIGYRVRLSKVEYIKANNDYRAKIKVIIYDSVIGQMASIQIDDLREGEKETDNLPFSESSPILEDYSETTIPGTWLHEDEPVNDIDDIEIEIDDDHFMLTDDNISQNIQQIIDKGDQSDFKNQHKSDFKNQHKIERRNGYKVYDINTDQDGDKIISDITELSYDSLCIIFEDVFKEMMAVTLFSVN